MSEQGDRSFKARPQLEQVSVCGCYYCLNIYSPTEIEEWVDSEKTAICPKCGIDAVVPFDKDQDINLNEFEQMLKKWHGESFE